MGTNFPDNSYMPRGNGDYLLRDVSPILDNADITFGNLEGVILDTGGVAKKCKNPKTCYLFRSPSYYLDHLKKAGFDLLSNANNHVNDFGLVGRQETARYLDEYGFHFAGFYSKPYTILEYDGKKIGFAAFAPNQGTASLYDSVRAMKVVSHLDTIADIVLVSIHGGAEGKEYQHVTRENEYFLGHNRGNIYDFSRKMIDSGADLVFGHGPHVTRAVDLYKGKFIAYSLGNFCTYRRFNLAGPNGYAPIIKTYLDSEGNFLKAEVFSIRQVPPGGPKLDADHTAFKYMQTLTEEDIPEAELKFELPFIYPVK